MNKSRREVLKLSGIVSLGMGAGWKPPFRTVNSSLETIPGKMESDQSIIGQYGEWANSLRKGKLPYLSFRNEHFNELESWRSVVMQKVLDRMGVPDLRMIPKVIVERQSMHDGLAIEDISWQLPYGRPTKARVIKPANAKGRLPAVLAFHDHGGNKYFGLRKITRNGEVQHPMMKEHQNHYYEGKAWANELAKRGYVVMVPDAFAFASRRVKLEDVPEKQRKGLNVQESEDSKYINSYNSWASDHEHIMAKSLFCGGTTWPGVFYAEDKVALEILLGRDDVDPGRVGCGGLSGGGLRTVMMAGLDHRIKCAVCVGFMSTWADFLLNKSYTHTWMTYVPRLAHELDFPEILGMRIPLPTLVLNDKEDQLYTLPEMRKADRILQELFEKANAPDHYRASYFPGLHKFDIPMQQEAFAWWDQWLKN
ncbi:MAG: alpha/beta hydrolase family protein [Cyclobacteriaceae bacterium]